MKNVKKPSKPGPATSARDSPVSKPVKADPPQMLQPFKRPEAIKVRSSPFVQLVLCINIHHLLASGSFMCEPRLASSTGFSLSTYSERKPLWINDHGFVLCVLPVIQPTPTSLKMVIVGAMMNVWRVMGKIIASVLCSIVCNSCAQYNAHR